MDRYLQVSFRKEPSQECGCYDLNNMNHNWLNKREARRLVSTYLKLEQITRRILEKGLAEKATVKVTFETKD